jgi:hypothetical protein
VVEYTFRQDISFVDEPSASAIQRVLCVFVGKTALARQFPQLFVREPSLFAPPSAPRRCGHRCERIQERALKFHTARSLFFTQALLQFGVLHQTLLPKTASIASSNESKHILRQCPELLFFLRVDRS